MSWKFDTAADIGGREEQQDRVRIVSRQSEDRHLVVVADGMGGHQDGALAAQAVAEAAEYQFRCVAEPDPIFFLKDLCAQAHQSINRLGGEGDRSAGSTCVFLYLDGPEAHWAHVGDSRLYHFRAGETLSATVDHSMLELLKADGRFDHGDAEEPGLRNQIYRRLGGQHAPDPDVGSTWVMSGDLFLLCSDGFWESVSSGEARSLLGSEPISEGCASSLVATARERGGDRGDNIGLALAQWLPEIKPPRRSLLSILFGRGRRSPEGPSIAV